MLLDLLLLLNLLLGQFLAASTTRRHIVTGILGRKLLVLVDQLAQQRLLLGALDLHLVQAHGDRGDTVGVLADKVAQQLEGTLASGGRRVLHPLDALLHQRVHVVEGQALFLEDAAPDLESARPGC